MIIKIIKGTKMSFNECSNIIGIDPELCKQKNFFEFVYKKIARDQKNRYVQRGHEYVDIFPNNSSAVRVIPTFKEVNMNQLQNLQEEVEKATKIIINNESIAQVYIVCPKNEKFMKHIELKLPQLEKRCKNEYRIKIIPYSLKSIIRTS
jgi:hypothetical protein